MRYDFDDGHDAVMDITNEAEEFGFVNVSGLVQLKHFKARVKLY